MYKRNSGGWMKHVDFIILDILCLQVALMLAYACSGYGWDIYTPILYRNVAMFLGLADLMLLICRETMKGVIRRGHFREFTMTVKQAVFIEGIALLYLFLLQEGQNYSRLVLLLMPVCYSVVAYAVRELWKWHLQKKKTSDEGKSALLIAASEDVVERVVKTIKENNYAQYIVAGISLIGGGKYSVGEKIDGVPVVAEEAGIPHYVCQDWIDEVLVVTSDEVPYPGKLLSQLMETGVTVHLGLAKVMSEPGKKQFVEKIGPYTVLTTSINYASSFQLFLKRAMDIMGGLVGCIITVLLLPFVGTAIYLASPGPIFFAQERVGKNGKRFKMYKFRSMYMDAEARKAELMKDNRLGDGKMFKLDFDPRVIGNKILPDGSHKTGIGDFIRRTSLDEFPQFFNVLKGDMSIVGTRPPLISETNLYELHHKARLAIKPGITGMWQVSGRSDITDFEEVVRLDREYISNWNIGMDIKILVKTVMVVLKEDGSM
ncbi:MULTISPECIES: sugar transferase [Clostridium]|jgi:exopolysaccharide biosynthesis polyprenyl glycosylphosphotransferase|uniref:sugar transferase n=1 Tax=Clostridium TaxID=1485 RepID=UPI000E4EDF98|nr:MULTISPECIES: sugar transferase [Clostridium]RHO09169.1 sugar transferase [Clostridium sp. AM18-55]